MFLARVILKCNVALVNWEGWGREGGWCEGGRERGKQAEKGARECWGCYFKEMWSGKAFLTRGHLSRELKEGREGESHVNFSWRMMSAEGTLRTETALREAFP